MLDDNSFQQVLNTKELYDTNRAHAKAFKVSENGVLIGNLLFFKTLQFIYSLFYLYFLKCCFDVVDFLFLILCD